MHAHDRPTAHEEVQPTAPAHREAERYQRRDSPRSRSKWVFFGFLALSAFFLIVEHRAHLFGFLPWLILLACPLMHFFMHRGHGHGGHGHVSRRDDAGEGR